MRLLQANLAGVCLCLLVAGHAWAQEWPTPAAANSLLRQAAAELSSFTLKPDLPTYTQRNLGEYIDGEAERHFAYNFQWAVASVFTDKRTGTNLAADLYCYDTPLDAFGAFSQDRDPNLPPDIIPLPGQTGLSVFWRANQLHLWRGNVYLRIVPATLKDTARPAVLELAQAITAKLPTAPPPPSSFKLLPTRDLILESMKYQRRNVLGQASLSHALLASYGRRLPNRSLEVSMQLALFETADQAAAAKVYAALQAFTATAGAPTAVGALGDAAFSVRDQRLGRAYVMRQSNYVALLTQVRDMATAEALLRELGKNVRVAGTPGA